MSLRARQTWDGIEILDVRTDVQRVEVDWRVGDLVGAASVAGEVNVTGNEIARQRDTFSEDLTGGGGGPVTGTSVFELSNTQDVTVTVTALTNEPDDSATQRTVTVPGARPEMIVASCGSDPPLGPVTPDQAVELQVAVENTGTAAGLVDAIFYVNGTGILSIVGFVNGIEVQPGLREIGRFTLTPSDVDLGGGDDMTVYVDLVNPRVSTAGADFR